MFRDKNNLAIKQSLGSSHDEIYSLAYALLEKKGNRGAILDFGSGKGKFLKEISKLNFFKKTGADLMDRPEGLAPEIEWIQGDLNHALALEDSTFDVIISLEVIEHLENPRKMIRELKRLLKPRGLLIISTPNNESFRSIVSLIFRGHFVSFLHKDYPAHITALVGLDLERIFNENNFSNFSLSYINKGLVPGMKGITWQKISFGLLQGKRFSDNVFALGIKDNENGK